MLIPQVTLISDISTSHYLVKLLAPASCCHAKIHKQIYTEVFFETDWHLFDLYKLHQTSTISLPTAHTQCRNQVSRVLLCPMTKDTCVLLRQDFSTHYLMWITWFTRKSVLNRSIGNVIQIPTLCCYSQRLCERCHCIFPRNPWRLIQSVSGQKKFRISTLKKINN